LFFVVVFCYFFLPLVFSLSFSLLFPVVMDGASYTLCVSKPLDRKFFWKLKVACLVLDEGHMVKNMASQRYSHLMKIKVSKFWLWREMANRRICLLVSSVKVRARCNNPPLFR